MQKAFDIPNIFESVKADYASGQITLQEAAEEWNRANWTPFVCEDYARQKLGLLCVIPPSQKHSDDPNHTNQNEVKHLGRTIKIWYDESSASPFAWMAFVNGIGTSSGASDSEAIEEAKAKIVACNLNYPIKTWYRTAFHRDKLGKSISGAKFQDLQDALSDGGNAYDIIGVMDSIVRERCFTRLAALQGVNYETIYSKWLESAQ